MGYVLCNGPPHVNHFDPEDLDEGSRNVEEYQARLFVAEKALDLGWGGISHSARLSPIRLSEGRIGKPCAVRTKPLALADATRVALNGSVKKR